MLFNQITNLRFVLMALSGMTVRDSYWFLIRSLKNRFVYRITNPHSIKGGIRNKCHPRATPIF